MCTVYWQILTDISKVLTASIIGMLTSQGTTSQQTAIFILVAMRT
jgi:hypothetical protein